MTDETKDTAEQVKQSAKEFLSSFDARRTYREAHREEFMFTQAEQDRMEGYLGEIESGLERLYAYFRIVYSDVLINHRGEYSASRMLLRVLDTLRSELQIAQCIVDDSEWAEALLLGHVDTPTDSDTAYTSAWLLLKNENKRLDKEHPEKHRSLKTPSFGIQRLPSMPEHLEMLEEWAKKKRESQNGDGLVTDTAKKD